MKVLHIATEKSWRGGENQLRLLVQGLKKRGFENHLVVQPESSAAKIFAEAAITHPITMRNDLDIIAATQIAALCRQKSIDLIHAHTARAHALGLLAKSILRTTFSKLPFLVVHRRVEQSGTLSFMARLKYLNRNIDRYICVSKAIANGMIDAGIKEQDIRVVYSAVDTELHRNHDVDRTETRKEFQLAPDDFVVSCVAAMEQAKGVDYLVEGWMAFKRRVPSAKLLMIGEGGLRAELDAGIKSSKYPDSVIFTGFRRDVPRLMAAADVLILPTLWEGLGTVLLDGLLAGCAIIGSNVGGVPEIIEDRKTGLLIPPKDPNAIANALNILAENPSLRSEMVAAGRIHVARHFSLEAMVDGVAGTYKELEP